MKLFGRKSAGSSPRPALTRPLSAYHRGASLYGEAPFSYGSQVREAYLENAIAQRAVRIVSEGAGGAPLSASDDRMLALVQRSSAGQGLIETMASYMLLHGNAFVQVICAADGAPAELFALRPDRVTIEPDKRGWPTAYIYRAGDNVTRLDAYDGDGRVGVIHIKGFHPTDDHYGLGCLGAARQAVGVHNAAAKWNKALLENAARPSGALVYDPGDGAGALSADQFERLKAEMEASFSGSGNAGRPMLLEGGLKWQSMSLSPADMDFVGLKAAAVREISLAFGVPPMLIGLPGDNNYANYKEANRALWRLTILPLAQKILDGLGQGLGDHFGGASLSVDLDKVPALSEDREALWARVSAADFLSPEEKRNLLGLA